MGLIHQRSNTAGALWKCPSQQQKWAQFAGWHVLRLLWVQTETWPNISSSLGEVFQVCSLFLVVQQDLCRNLLACAFSVSCCILQAFCLYRFQFEQQCTSDLEALFNFLMLWDIVGKNSTLPWRRGETKYTERPNTKPVSGSWVPSRASRLWSGSVFFFFFCCHCRHLAGGVRRVIVTVAGGSRDILSERQQWQIHFWCSKISKQSTKRSPSWWIGMAMAT